MIKPDFIIPNKRGIYLRRWLFTRWSDDKHQWKGRRLPNAYLHNMLDHDDDRALHDHPWDNVSIVLWGGYIEHVFAYPPVEGQPLPPVITKRRRFGSIVRRKAEDAHRLDLYTDTKYRRIKKFPAVQPDFYILSTNGAWAITKKRRPCWTIFLTWRKRREWGFWCERDGIVGQKVCPFDAGGGPINYVLTHRGQVATWVHQKTFHEERGNA